MTQVNYNTAANLLSGQAADGSGSTLQWSGGVGYFYAYGTFGGGTVTFQISYDGGTTWFAVSAATTLTANGQAEFELPSGQIRATVSGSTTPSLSAGVRRR